jgi:hypothetical protein
VVNGLVAPSNGLANFFFFSFLKIRQIAGRGGAGENGGELPLWASRQVSALLLFSPRTARAAARRRAPW